ncbi:DUF4221 family protein [Dokdonia ponticola]|uniref:DUF4221 family protein n=1 Tax=Dokdonia ponticola TaxID=2041041 RepID=A0ABV9HXG8_9FLAO
MSFIACENHYKSNQNELLSAKSSNQNSDTPKPKEYSKSLVNSGSIKIPLDLETSFYAENIQYIDAEQLLITLPLSSNTLNIYDLSDVGNKLTKKIKLQTEGPDSVKGEVGGFYYHNKDSIFVLSKFTFEVFQVDYEGKVKNSYPLLKEFDPKLPVPLGSTFSPIKYINGKLYISCVAPEEQVQGTYENSFIEYDIEKKKTFFRGVNPDKLNSGNWEGIARLYYDYNKNEDTFVLAFSISDEIVQLKLPSQINTYNVKSDYINSEDAKPFSTDFKKAADYLERGKYSFSTPKYWGILSDWSNDYYYRIGIQPNTYADFSKGIFPNTIIMVMDDTFNKILEHEMNPTEYQYDMSFVGEKGLYIANKEKYNEDDNFLTFDIFTIE